MVTGNEIRLREFHDRKQNRSSFGKFLEQSDIRKLGPTHSSDLFRRIPGIVIATAPAGGNSIRIRGCQPMVVLDGQRVPGAELDGIFYLRSVRDSDALRERLDRGGAVVVVGAGWIGAEVAASARQRGLDVTVIEPASVPLERVLGDRKSVV